MKSDTQVFVVDAIRTPIGRLGGELATVRPDDLAAQTLVALLSRHPGLDPAGVAEVVWGAANQAGEDNRNVARMAALLAGLPVEVPGFTVNRLCGSGLQAVISAGHALRDGWGEVMIAGGSESMSRAPYVQTKPELGYPDGAPTVADTVLGWRLVNPVMEELYPPISLGETAERVADKYQISRSAQDRFALRSHQRAVAAQRNGRFVKEIMPLTLSDRSHKRQSKVVNADQGPRPDTSLEKLSALPPVFLENGTVTAGNSSPMSDGAAAVLLATETGLNRYDLVPRVRLVGAAAVGVHPDLMGIGPVPATQKALQRVGWEISDLDMVELNEAFASQAVACIELLGLDPELVNMDGGAIALGHPLGCSGARILTTLVHGMKAHQRRRGLATMCIGAGQGISLLVEAVT